MELFRYGLRPDLVAQLLGIVGGVMATVTGLVPRDNQYRCAALLLGQRLVELDTGEGKSVAVAMAAAVAALYGAPVHVLTANVYLAQRDAADFSPFYVQLGLSVAAVSDTGSDDERRRAWEADVVYASARTLGFDVLRDEIADDPGSSTALLSRGLCVALVDEADSLLIDEARTPLVIAHPVSDPQERARVWRSLDLAGRLEWGRDAKGEPGLCSARLTPRGEARLAALIAAEGEGAEFFGGRHLAEMVAQALVALHLLRRDVDYLVRGREVVLVDAASGRPDAGRRLPRSLHALVAVKEGLPAPMANEIQASMSYPRLFARYHHLGGTSGTLAEAAAELRRNYGLIVTRVERALPSRLCWGAMRLFSDRARQFDAAVEQALALADRQRCVLLATDSVADSVELAQRFERCGRAVAVLDARHDGQEHALIARAGECGAITVSTQMAGRGTDIPVSPQAARAGGLHVLILQHNRSRRIDRQVAGRAARQGDPGSVEHWLRLSDSPLAPDRLPRVLGALVAALGPWHARQPNGCLRQRVLALMWRSCQVWWRLEDTVMRSDGLQRDRRWSRRLHFASMPERDD